MLASDIVCDGCGGGVSVVGGDIMAECLSAEEAAGKTPEVVIVKSSCE
jgi:hypothetical protein